MSTRILLQTILKLQDQIKTGAANFMDVSAEYFKSTGNFLDDSQKAVALQEINKIAPSNVVEDVFTKAEGIDSTSLKDDLMKTDNPFSDLVKTTEEGPKTLDQRRADAIKELGSDTPATDLVSKQMGTKLRGDETFGELMEMKESKQGLGSLYPRGEPGEIFDIQNDKRREVAEFMKAMRAAGIKNEDVMKTAKITDVAEGKRAATTLARAADMAADSKVKQELLSELDDDIANYGPDWWKGMGYNEGPMGRESVGNLLEHLTTTVNNGIYDDLLQRGVPEEKVDDVFRYIANIRDNVKYDPKALVSKIAEDLELEDIKYDTTFWNNYLDEILKRIQKPEPRFADGGLV